MEKKKLDGRTILVASALFIAIFAQVGFIGSVLGPGGQQHNIWGYDAAEGMSPPGSTISSPRNITAWIDGVNYAYNWTFETGEYDLYVDGDVWGVLEDDLVKDGGWNGDLIYYFLDYDPMDYFLNISSHTSIFGSGSPSLYEHMDNLYFDTQTDWDGAADTNLRGLKINEVVVNPGDGFPDYVILYDPCGEVTLTELTDASKGYYLQKDDPWPTSPPDPDGQIFDFNANPSYVEELSPRYYYINLTGFDLDNTADELKLVWKNPANYDPFTPTADHICNDTDVIVDRVEWGEYDNHIDPSTPPDNRDYDNTSMADYMGALIVGQSFKRTINGTDTDDCAADFSPLIPATPRPLIPPPPPWTPDWIEIVDTPGTGTTAFPLTLTVGVGVTITGYAAAFNNSAPGFYYGDISVTWTVTPSGTQNATTLPGSGTSSDFWSGWIGGDVEWKAEDSYGNTYTVTITILSPEPDSIKIVDTSGTGLTEISDQAVGPGVYITGYAAGYNNSIGYFGDVSVSWTVIPLGSEDASTFPLTGTTSDFNSGSKAGQVTWKAEYGVGIIDTVTIDIIITYGIPGAPYDLEVHKGPWKGVGTLADLVLNWTSPGWNYTNLLYNVVYYDTDIADGFQYDNRVLFEPNSTAGDSEDGCVLPGFLTDPNDYVFVVRCTNDTQGLWENQTGTNVGYKYIMILQKTGPTLTNTLWVSLPYICDLKKAEDIAGLFGEFKDNLTIEKVSRWDYTTQRYQHRKWVPFPTGHWEGNFTINPGDAVAVQITISTPYEWSIVGAYDENVVFSLIKTPPDLTNSKWLSLPYHKAYQDFEDIANLTDAEFTDNSTIEKVSKWDYATQAYEHRKWVPFPTGHWEGNPVVPPSPGEAILFQITRAITPYPYKPEVIGL